MASFKFASGKKVYTIEGRDREYIVDIGNVETMKLWRSKIEVISTAASTLTGSGDQIDGMVSLCRDVVNMILDGDFDELWELCGHNLYSMLGLVADLSKLISEGQRDIGKDYGL